VSGAGCGGGGKFALVVVSSKSQFLSYLFQAARERQQIGVAHFSTFQFLLAGEHGRTQSASRASLSAEVPSV
jgi:hypothetical protein